MTSISSPGIGSGLDIQGIVTSLMELERQPLQRLQLKQQQYGAQISAYGSLISAASAFKASMDSLGSPSALNIFNTSSSNPDVIDITATDNPDQGNYSVEVTRLAAYHKMASLEIASTDTFGGTAGDTFSIQVGSLPEDTISVNLSTAMTLEDIRDAINADANNPGVNAYVINGDGGMQKLILTAENTGSDSALTLFYGGTIAPVAFDFQTVNNISGDTSLLDAEFIVDGYTITRPSNSISDVISGVTFSLVTATPGVGQIISVEQDLGGIQQQVQLFASTYNDLRSAIDDLRNGDLGSESALRMIENQLSNILNTPAAGGVFSTLSDVGLILQKDGSMELDSTVLESAMAQDSSAVSQLFAADGEGFANRLSSIAESWIANSGLIESRTDGLNARSEILTDRQTALERNLVIIEQRYRNQFSSLDILVGQMQATSSYLTQQLAALPDLFLGKSK
jgi:flagellar hook-associated protein 2